MGKIKDLTGFRVGRLTVIRRGEDRFTPSGRRIVYWLCRCDCGNEKEIAAAHLKDGGTVSCGCYGDERRAEANQNKDVHGLSRTRIYHLFQNMKYRCNNPNAEGYDTYGGRGIKVCDEWSQSGGFEKFYEWAMKNGYDDSLTIDRIDVNGDYSPENCRWANWETQYNNTQNSVKLTYNGKTQTAAQWARELGLDRHTIYSRIKKGKPIEEVLAPRQRRKPQKK